MPLSRRLPARAPVASTPSAALRHAWGGRCRRAAASSPQAYLVVTAAGVPTLLRRRRRSG